MNHNRSKILFLIVVALLQLYVPAKMIWNREKVLETGSVFKFKTAPIDPSDPFRGKYITLNYEENSFKSNGEKDWKPGEKIFVHLTKDKDGYAKIKAVSKEKPEEQEDFVQAKVWLFSGNGSDNLSIEYPFDRFYMEESKAYDAELTYQKYQLDTTKATYALVHVKDGEAVLKDVLIDDISIREMIQKERSGN